MHGLSSGFTFIVNAEVDSMGGIVDGGAGIGNKPSPRRTAIEKAQAELRLEYDVREERRRELEFLEKGGNPLDFTFGHAASASVQSTSHTYQQPDQFLTSEAKGSSALNASPHGDSVESSGRLGISATCEPNSADNFHGDDEIPESGRKLKNPSRSSIAPSEQSSQLNGSQNVKELEDPIFRHPKKGQAYRRRNRSRPNRDAYRSSSSDLATRGGSESLPGRLAMLSKSVASGNQFDMESDGTHALHLSTTSRASEISDRKVNVLTLKDKQDDFRNSSVEAVDDIPATSTIAEPNFVAEKENLGTVDVDCVSIEQKEDNTSAAQCDDSGKINGDVKSTPNDTLNSNALILQNGIDFESLHTHTSCSVNGNGITESDFVTNLKNVDDDAHPLGESSTSFDNEVLKEKLDNNPVGSIACFREDQNFSSHQSNSSIDKDQEIDKERLYNGDKVEYPINVEELGMQDNVTTIKDEEYKVYDADVSKAENTCPVRLTSSDPSLFEINKRELCAPPPTSKLQTSSESQQKKLDKSQEDRVLEEARIIEAKRRRIAELSVGVMPRDNRRKSHWDFVLEEMTWLANDFTQERVWKMTAAAQICRRAALASRLRMEEKTECWKQNIIAQTMTKAVMAFWHSAKLYVGNDTGSHSSQIENRKLDASSGFNEIGQRNSGPVDPNKDEDSEEKLQYLGKKQIFKYAVRFLQDNCSLPFVVKSDGSGTLDVVCDVAKSEDLWQDQLTEENLFYTVPPGAVETYRKSIDACLSDFERANTSILEEVDTSMYDPTSEIVYQENGYGEDEGENLYYQPGSGMHDSGRPMKKKQKILKVYANRYGLGSAFGPGGVDSRNGTSPSALLGKRPANNLQVGLIPTKKTRTAPRQRVICSFTPGSAGVALTPGRTDASSGDTNSFQDDQSTLHGPNFARGSEVDSPMDYDKQFTIDAADNTGKFKKKMKFKNPGASYSGWPVDPAMQNDQKDHVRKRHDHLIDSNGSSGFSVHHTKKPKIKHLENSFENNIHASGSVASPVASQMSNMSSKNKIIKILGVREKRKAKGIKVSAVQPSSGSPWSSFEDQALIVLVHDMGPNWELISDAINSTLRFKCIFRKPQECMERHINLMERTPGDGADSAEDSGSSQPYPSTLPGIPKGSARQLFQQLQRPMEEDTIKSHFDKIIHIAKQLHYRKKQNGNQDMKQISTVHGSHVAALSQVIPNNVSGVILTPLDLCDFSVSNQDAIPLGFQGPHAGGLSSSNQGSSPSMHPPGGLNPSIQGLPGSSSMGMGINMSSQPPQFTNSRYSVPRSTSLPTEDQPRLQQYGHMLPGRSVQASNMSSGSLSGTERGVRMLPGGNSVGMVGGMSRSMPNSRPGIQVITSSSMLNSGSLVSSNMGGVPSNMNIQTTSGQGNSMFRAREALHMARPAKSLDHQRQMMVPEASSSVPPFSALSSGFTNQTSPPLQPYGASHHQPMPQQHSHVLSGPHHTHLPGAANHVTPEQQQAYLRLARDRQIQQRILQRQHQQQQHPTSNALMTQSPSSMQSGSQRQSPSSSQSVSLPPISSSPATHVSSLSSQSQKNSVPCQGPGRNSQSGASGLMINQGGKQRDRQASHQLHKQYQQSGRQHPQQRQQSQLPKLVKGMGRRDMLVHQNLPTDPSHLNGFTVDSGDQVAEKGEQTVHMMQSQGLYTANSLNAMQPSKSLPSSQTSGHLQQQKPYANSVLTTAKQVQQIPSHVDGDNPGPATAVTSSPTSTGVPSLSHQKLQGQSQPPLKVVNQSQPERGIQQNCQLNSDPLIKSQPDNVQAEQNFASNTSLNAGLDSIDSTCTLSLSSSANYAVHKQVQEPVVDCAMTDTATPAEPVSGRALNTSSGIETSPSVSEALGQRQLPGHLAAHEHGVQFQHKQSPLQEASLRQPSLTQRQSQHQLQPLEKLSQRVPQPQPQLQIQGAKSSVFTRTHTSGLE